MTVTVRATSCALVIPALNEAESIGCVVNSVRPYGQPIVVDDGSADGTGDIAGRAGAVVIRHEMNRGYDSALATGLQCAIERGFEFAITLDGDGQHHPETLRLFVSQLRGGADLVVGIRDKRQRLCEGVFSCFTNVLWNIKDPLCGMKGYRLFQLRELAHLRTYESIGTELTIRAARSGWRIAQIPVPTRHRDGASRFGSGFLPNWRILQALVGGLVRAHRLPSHMALKHPCRRK